MPETKIDSADYGDQEGTETKFSVASVDTDAPTGDKETLWNNAEFNDQLGFYKTMPEIKSAIDARASWTIGKGYTADELTMNLLSSIKGYGFDTFNTLIENMVRVADIGGDSYAEIIRDTEGLFINLKPLDPSIVQIVADSKGRVKHYNLLGKTPLEDGTRKVYHKLKPDEMFRLCRNRTADEIHGESLINAVKTIIVSRNEMLETQRLVARRFAKPWVIFHMDTDNETEIATFKTKADKISTQGENFYVPKGTIVPEIIAVSENALLSLTPIINNLNDNFYRATGVPQIVVGGSQEITEANGKIAYLSWEQTVSDLQLYVKEQVLSQLYLDIQLEFPASLQNELLSDQSKSEKLQASTPEDTSVQGIGLDNAQGVQPQ